MIFNFDSFCTIVAGKLALTEIPALSSPADNIGDILCTRSFADTDESGEDLLQIITDLINDDGADSLGLGRLCDDTDFDRMLIFPITNGINAGSELQIQLTGNDQISISVIDI